MFSGADKALGYETVHRLGELDWSAFHGAYHEMCAREDAGHLTADVTFVALDVTSNASVATVVRNVRGYLAVSMSWPLRPDRPSRTATATAPSPGAVGPSAAAEPWAAAGAIRREVDTDEFFNFS
ncbi:hypothetical protein ACFWDQ_13550 [Streptomyces sp. NPDC060053]|uniref:hypothetical protein n=1 Tax=Streptomyces sp. NPDC060053 TaxID=3347047 RepID=UPI0036A4CCFF